MSYENSSLFLQVGKSIFFTSKDIEEVFSSLFLLLMSCAYGVLPIKVYGRYSLFCNYLIQFCHKRSN